MKTPQPLISQLRKILDRFARASKIRDSEDAEEEYGIAVRELQNLSCDGLVDRLEQAAGQSTARKKAIPHVLFQLAHLPKAVEQLRNGIRSPDPEFRRIIIEAIGVCQHTELAGLLNAVITEDPDLLCRIWAIDAASRLHQDVNLPAVLSVGRDPDLEQVVIAALARYGREEGRELLNEVFERPSLPRPSRVQLEAVDDRESVVQVHAWSSCKHKKLSAAWGLAKLGDLRGVAHLGEMLYDPGYEGRRRKDWGESLRAAQALADVFALPSVSDKDGVDAVRMWWRENGSKTLAGGGQFQAHDAGACK